MMLTSPRYFLPDFMRFEIEKIDVCSTVIFVLSLAHISTAVTVHSLTFVVFLLKASPSL